MKLKNLLKSTIVSLFVFSFLFVDVAFAATNISFSPASGTVGEDFDVAVMINTGSEEINGIDLDVTFEGDITYSSSTAGNLGCDPIIDSGTAGTVGVTCFITPGQTHSGSGTLVTLSFTGTADGSVSFGIDNVDVAGSSEGTVSGASLTVDLDYTGEDSSGGDDDALPETGFFSDNIFLIVGGVFLVVGIVMAAVPETWNWMTLKKKQEAKSKEKFEKKVVSKAK